MKKRSLNLLVSTLLVTLIGSTIVGCGNSSQNDVGLITVSGSSALLPLMEQSIEKFNEKNPDIEINAQAGGSGTGLTQVVNGTVDIGNSDVSAGEKLDQDKVNELVDHKVVAQGFALAVNKNLGIDDLTKDQIKDIFSGKVTNWNQIRKADGTMGPDKEILVIHRTSGSGTRSTFENTILDGDKTLENDAVGVTQDSNGAVLTTMKQNDAAISYLSLAYMNTGEAKEAITAIKINGVNNSEDNIKNGLYPFWGYGHMYTKGEPNEAAQLFIDFISSDENKESLSNLGFISGAEIKVK